MTVSVGEAGIEVEVGTRLGYGRRLGFDAFALEGLESMSFGPQVDRMCASA
jgi:hypothetical protein